ncbi:MAG TPA: HPr family phosphocarrier protein [Armatimonadetes bacterium]|nr:HPr family phosphocarrier protein [Armatimonadota bacterium]
METFEYVIKDQLGLHARPAGLLIKEAKKFSSQIVIEQGESQVSALHLTALLSMGITIGTKVRVIAEGADAEAAIEAIKNFFEENL